jgi:hypothetical protein
VAISATTAAISQALDQPFIPSGSRPPHASD